MTRAQDITHLVKLGSVELTQQTVSEQHRLHLHPGSPWFFLFLCPLLIVTTILYLLLLLPYFGHHHYYSTRIISTSCPCICGLRTGCGKNGNSYICFSGRLRLHADHNPPSSHTQGARRQRKHSSAEIHKEPLCVSLPMGPADHDTNPRGSSATCNCRHFGASQA